MRSLLTAVFRAAERLDRDALVALADPRHGGALLAARAPDAPVP